MLAYYLNSRRLGQRRWGAGNTNKSFSTNMKLTVCMGLFYRTVFYYYYCFVFFKSKLNVSMWGKKLPVHSSIQLFLKENPWDLLWLKNLTFKWCRLILGRASHHCQSEVKSMQFAVLTIHDWIQIPPSFAPGQRLIMTHQHLKASNIFPAFNCILTETNPMTSI